MCHHWLWKFVMILFELAIKGRERAITRANELCMFIRIDWDFLSFHGPQNSRIWFTEKSVGVAAKVCKREKKERKREIERERREERRGEKKHNTHIILYTHTHTQTHVKRRESIVIMPNLCSNVSRFEEKSVRNYHQFSHRKLLAITLYLLYYAPPPLLLPSAKSQQL